MMNQELKQQWIDALRSGEYEQTQHYLNRHGKYCCLGVLCEVGLKNGYKLTKEYYEKHSVVAYDNEDGNLPQCFRKKIGLDYDLSCNLAHLNDNGASFSELADFIEEQA